MLRQVSPILLACFFLSGCEKLLEVATKTAGEANGGSQPTAVPADGSTSPVSPTPTGVAGNPEVAVAFQEIARASYVHNLTLLQYHDAGRPGNGAAYSEGIRALDKAGRRHGGLTKRIIDSVNATKIREKAIFEVFDTMDKQMKGMKTQGGSVAVQRRNYIQILDSGIRAYDKAVTSLEGGEDAQLRYDFKRKRVPSAVAEEFIRWKHSSGKIASAAEKEMFTEARAALQAYRNSFSTTNAAKAKAYVSEAGKHEKQSKKARARMFAELRKMLKQPKRA